MTSVLQEKGRVYEGAMESVLVYIGSIFKCILVQRMSYRANVKEFDFAQNSSRLHHAHFPTGGMQQRADVRRRQYLHTIAKAHQFHLEKKENKITKEIE